MTFQISHEKYKPLTHPFKKAGKNVVCVHMPPSVSEGEGGICTQTSKNGTLHFVIRNVFPYQDVVGFNVSMDDTCLFHKLQSKEQLLTI